VSFTLPFRTYSEGNLSEHWTKRATRHKLHKEGIAKVMKGLTCKITMPCTITLTRYAKQFLDAHDNLRTSFKYIVDKICAEITGDHRPGRADGRAGFTFQYEQKKSKEYAISVLIEFDCTK